jgi:hypothetical protein
VLGIRPLFYCSCLTYFHLDSLRRSPLLSFLPEALLSISSMISANGWRVSEVPFMGILASAVQPSVSRGDASLSTYGC